MTVPKGHHGSAGIVPTFLRGDEVHILHRFAEAHGLLDQQAATVLLRAALHAWDGGVIEAVPKVADTETPGPVR